MKVQINVRRPKGSKVRFKYDYSRLIQQIDSMQECNDASCTMQSENIELITELLAKITQLDNALSAYQYVFNDMLSKKG